MQPERRIVFIRQAGMCARRVKSSEESLYEPRTLSGPLVQLREQERRVTLREPDPSLIACRR